MKKDFPADRPELVRMLRKCVAATEVILDLLYEHHQEHVPWFTCSPMPLVDVQALLPEDLRLSMFSAGWMLETEGLVREGVMGLELTDEGLALQARRAGAKSTESKGPPLPSWWLETAQRSRKLKYSGDDVRCRENRATPKQCATIEAAFHEAAVELVLWTNGHGYGEVPPIPRVEGALSEATIWKWLHCMKGPTARRRHPLSCFAADLRVPLHGEKMPLLDAAIARWKAMWTKENAPAQAAGVPPPPGLVASLAANIRQLTAGEDVLIPRTP